MQRSIVLSLCLLFALVLSTGLAAMAQESPGDTPGLPTKDASAAQVDCNLLDDPTARGVMSGMFEVKLLLACGRQNELGQVTAPAPAGPALPEAPTFGVDVLVNNPAGDLSGSHTQSETSLTRSETTGTLCSAYNDSYHGVVQGLGFSGYSRSTDSGTTWTDKGPIPNGGGGSSGGDPSMVWRKTDGAFYFTSLHSSGLGFWKSTNDCDTFSWVGMVHSGANDDKELMAIDNNPSSPYYGRIYIAWINFNDARIYSTYSTNAGTTWSAPIALSGAGLDVQGAWPAVAPNGDLYVAWVRWNPYPSGPIDMQIVRSTNGGVSFSAVTNPLTGGVNPRAATPTNSCGRPALNGNIRYLPSPQITLTPNGHLHVVYARDPDGYNVGDVINVYYRRSTDNGTTWGAEVLLNDDGTTRDQFFPTISAGPSGRIVTTWYDRRLDANNLLFDYYMRYSDDGGTIWLPSQRVSDVSSPVYLDPQLATCYHGDYDQQIQDAAFAYIQWSDDRNIQGGHQDPDVWFDKNPFSPDFTVGATPETLAVCAPGNAVFTINVGSLVGFNSPVTLSSAGTPLGTIPGFVPNPVTPPGSSTFTIGNTGAAAPGVYPLTVTGTSSPLVHSVNLSLNLANATPGQTTLTAPAIGAVNQPVRPTFTWTAASQAATYDIQVATDGGFTNVVASASGLAATTFTPSVDLNTSTTYFWRVRPNNACGSGAYSPVFNFTTVAAPGDCGPGSVANVVYQYGFEAGAGGWTSSGTGNSWAIATSNPHSGASHYRANDPAVVSDQRLASPAVALPAGQNPVILKFWHVPNLEPNGTTACYDGGILEATTNAGTTWTQVTNLLAGTYRGPVAGSFGNPLAGLNAWCGTSTYLNSVADVSSLAGTTAQFRWRLGSDSSVTGAGWDVDDVTVQSCQPAGPTCFWADVNCSCSPGGTIDTLDITVAATAWQAYQTTGAYSLASDVNCRAGGGCDGVNDIKDVQAVASMWGTACP
jgi:hypothetical protein